MIYADDLAGRGTKCSLQKERKKKVKRKKKSAACQSRQKCCATCESAAQRCREMMNCPRRNVHLGAQSQLAGWIESATKPRRRPVPVETAHSKPQAASHQSSFSLFICHQPQIHKTGRPYLGSPKTETEIQTAPLPALGDDLSLQTSTFSFFISWSVAQSIGHPFRQFIA